MMKAKSTSDLGTKHEELVVKRLRFDNARRSRSSGASFHDPIDVTSDGFVIECEATEGKSKSIGAPLWEEVKRKAFGGRYPAISIQFENDQGKKYTLIAFDIEDIEEILMEEFPKGWG